ncbi:MAG: glycosyl hydrolase [Saprospiraceae bacterium]
MKNLLFLSVLLLFSFIDISSQAVKPDPNQKYYDAMEWRSIGPYRGGRSCAVTGVPGQPNLFYFGSAGGGVWRSKNGGTSWKNISDGFFGGSIGAVAVSSSDNNVLYVGGGEKTVRGNVSYGYGVWKTEDAGKTWKQKGLKNSRHISRIRIHPDNPDVAFAAVMGDLYKSSNERGVYKTTNGGNTWRRVLFANADAGAVDLVIDPNNARILYATTWRIRRTPYSLESGGEGSSLWKSTDSGETWKNISKNEGLPEGIWGISAVAVSPANSERVWALIENDKGGIYRSDDGGKTWKKTNESRSLRQRAWYYTRIYADTHDKDKLYVVNVSYHKSTDGGKTFQASNAPHGDHHDLWIAPEDPQRMIMADDGGAQVSFDGGESWSTYHNQPTAQYYRVTTDNHFPYRILVAQQDNSTIRVSHRSSGRAITEDDWESTAGGESAHIAPDPDDPEIVYGGSYGGFLTRKDHRLNTTRGINVWPDNPMGYGAEGMKYRFQWNFPIFFSKHNRNKLYTGSNHLHMSTDEGQSWEIISPDLTRNDKNKLVSSGGPITKDNTGVEYYCTIFAADESPLEEGLIWVGSDDGLVHVTRNGGENWINVTPKGMPEWMMINSIEPDPHNAGTCYFAGTRYKMGDYAPYLYKTTDFGKSWSKIVNGIKGDHFTRVVRVDPTKAGLLYAGTETGMYISYNDGRQWYPFQQNLPIVPITDLAIKNNNLIAATQGRSLWLIDDLTLVHQVANQSKSSGDRLFDPMDAYRYGGGGGFGGARTGVGQNHPGGVTSFYYLNDYLKKDTLIMSIYSENGKLVRTYSTHAEEKSNMIKEVKKGANKFNWNFRHLEAKSFDGMIMWSGSLRGQKAVPGSYRIEMTHRGKSQSQSFNIIADPRLELTQADYQNKFNFIQEINDKVTEAHEAIIEIRKVKEKLAVLKKEYESEEDLVLEATRIDSLIGNVEKELYQTKNRSRQDPLNFPIRLTNKLAHLNSLTGRGEFPPTEPAIAVKNEMVGLINDQLTKYKMVKENDIPALNAMVREKGLDFIKVD